MEIPSVSSDQMAEIDRKVPQKYGIDVERMMENAGYHVADFIRNNSSDPEIVVLVGRGNNGGDGISAARRLDIWGFNVNLYLVSDELEGIDREELEIARKIGIEETEEIGDADLLIDALIGYKLNGDPRPPFDEMIEEANSSDAEILSIDIPSGVDPDTGEGLDPHIVADHTITLGLPLEGLSEEKCGDVWLADISIPPQTYQDLGIEVDGIFTESPLLRIY